MDIKEKIKQIDLVQVCRNNGVELQRRGDRYIGLCAFHADNSPSFVIFPDNRWYCFSCQIGGDAVDFIQRLNGCTFREALQNLDISSGRPTKQTGQKIIDHKKRRAEIDRYRQRERDLSYTIGTLIRWTRQAMGAIKTVEDLEAFADYLQQLPFLKHVHLLLCTGDPSERREVVNALEDLEIIERTPLFMSSFDFSAWLKEFSQTGVQNEEPTNY